MRRNVVDPQHVGAGGDAGESSRDRTGETIGGDGLPGYAADR